MRQTTCRQTSLPRGTPVPGDRLHLRGHRSPGTHFSLAEDRLYQLAQARSHNVLHFLVFNDYVRQEGVGCKGWGDRRDSHAVSVQVTAQ